MIIHGSEKSSSNSNVLKPPSPNQRQLEKQIVDKILGDGYDKRIRPSGSNNNTGPAEGAVIVTVNTLIRSISKIDDVTMEYSVQLTLRQEWYDDRLAFNNIPAYRSYNINTITLTEQERIWKPDLFFRNEKEGHFHKIILPNVLLRIDGEGKILYSIRISLVLACPMDLKYYPLDKQNCTIEMASYGYTDVDLKFVWKAINPVQVPGLSLPKFTLESSKSAICTASTATGAYSCIRVDLVFKREFSYYLIQIYIPCCMLVIVSWVSFWLDPNAIPARVSLGVTTLLTMATQISGINANLPPVSYTKAIDVWTGVCLTFVFGALLEFALVNYASRSDAHHRMEQARYMDELRFREQQRQQLAAFQQQQIQILHQQQQQQQQHHQHQHQHQRNQQLPTSYMGPDRYEQNQTTDNGLQASYQIQFRQVGRTGAGDLLAQKGGAGGGPMPTGRQNGSQAASLIGPQYTLVSEHQLALGLDSKQANFGAGGHVVGDSTNTNTTTTTTANSTNTANNNNNYNDNLIGNLGPSGQANCKSSGQVPYSHQARSQQPRMFARLMRCCGRHYGRAGATKKNDGQVGSSEGKFGVNFVINWLRKFPSRSKRIDVISRIFFPLMFALFNLVYWCTYLFRDDDIRL